MLKKYIFIIQNSFVTFYRNKGSIWGIVVFLAIMFSIEGYFWYHFYDNNVNTVYTKNSIIMYIMIALTMHQIISCVGRPDQLSDDIESGSIDYFLLKPLNYPSILLSIHLGFVMARYIILSPMILLIFYMNGVQNLFDKLFLLFIFSVFCGILNGLINILLSCFTFFYKDSYGFIVLKETLFWALSGALIPLNVLPSYIQTINKFLPFGYIVFYPVNAVIHQQEKIALLFLIILLWIIILFFLANYIWSLGIKKYLAYGG